MINRVSSSGWCVGLLAALIVVSVTGCRSGGGSRDDASVRLINADPEAQDLSVSVDGQCVWKHSAFGSSTGFQGVGAGTYQVNIDALVRGERRFGQNYLLCQKGKAYTVVALRPATNSNESPGLRIFNEDKSTPVPADKARLRFINAGIGAGPVDVLFNNIVGFADVPSPARTQALLLDPGGYVLKVDAANDVQSFVGPLSLRFLPGHAYTLVAMGRSGATPGFPGISLQAFSDDR